MKTNDIFLEQLQKEAGIWSGIKSVGSAISKTWSKVPQMVPQQVKNIGELGLGTMGIMGAYDHFKDGQKIKQVYNNKNNATQSPNFKQASIEKDAFLGGLASAAKKVGTFIGSVGTSKPVAAVGGIVPFIGAMGAETLSGMHKEKRDQAYKINQEIQKQQKAFSSRNNNFQNFNKTSSVLNIPFKKYLKNSYYDARNSIHQSTNETLKYLKKTNAFDNELEKEAGLGQTLKNTWKAIGAKGTGFGKFTGGLLGLGMAADVGISLNNTRKNIQYAAPKVPAQKIPVPQRPLNTDMYGGGNHARSYQNTYGM